MQMDTCGNPRHARIAFEFDGVDVNCPLCSLLDLEEVRQIEMKKFLETVSEIKDELEEWALGR
jgi:hypothetical protein